MYQATENLPITTDPGDVQDFLATLPHVEEYNIPGWKEVEVAEDNQPLVPLGMFSNINLMDTSGVYFGERGEGKEVNFIGKPVDREISLITPFVREEVAEKLKKVQKLFDEIHQGYYLKVFDAYRPLEVQQSLFDAQKNNLRKVFPKAKEDGLDEMTQKFVSIPSSNKGKEKGHPSPHSTGGAIDLTIVQLSPEGSDKIFALNQIFEENSIANKSVSEANVLEISGNPRLYNNVKELIRYVNENLNLSSDHKLKDFFSSFDKVMYYILRAEIFRQYSTELNMGTGFDSFEVTAKPNYFEKKNQGQKEISNEDKEILYNRRLLHYVMNLCGFTGYPEEWWHFSYGDNMNAIQTRSKFAKYGTTELSESNHLIEEIRRKYYEIRTSEKDNATLETDIKTERPNLGRGFER